MLLQPLQKSDYLWIILVKHNGIPNFTTLRMTIFLTKKLKKSTTIHGITHKKRKSLRPKLSFHQQSSEEMIYCFSTIRMHTKPIHDYILFSRIVHCQDLPYCRNNIIWKWVWFLYFWLICLESWTFCFYWWNISMDMKCFVWSL